MSQNPYRAGTGQIRAKIETNNGIKRKEKLEIPVYKDLFYKLYYTNNGLDPNSIWNRFRKNNTSLGEAFGNTNGLNHFWNRFSESNGNLEDIFNESQDENHFIEYILKEERLGEYFWQNFFLFYRDFCIKKNAENKLRKSEGHTFLDIRKKVLKEYRFMLNVPTAFSYTDFPSPKVSKTDLMQILLNKWIENKTKDVLKKSNLLHKIRSEEAKLRDLLEKSETVGEEETEMNKDLKNAINEGSSKKGGMIEDSETELEKLFKIQLKKSKLIHKIQILESELEDVRTQSNLFQKIQVEDIAKTQRDVILEDVTTEERSDQRLEMIQKEEELESKDLHKKSQILHKIQSQDSEYEVEQSILRFARAEGIPTAVFRGYKTYEYLAKHIDVNISRPSKILKNKEDASKEVCPNVFAIMANGDKIIITFFECQISKYKIPWIENPDNQLPQNMNI